jgi:hypothetical protein
MAVAWPPVDSLADRNSSQKITLIWIIHRSSHLSWPGWPALQEAGSKGVQVIVPTATEEVGRPDLACARDESRDRGGPPGSELRLWALAQVAWEYVCADGAGRMGRWRYDREI